MTRVKRLVLVSHDVHIILLVLSEYLHCYIAKARKVIAEYRANVRESEAANAAITVDNGTPAAASTAVYTMPAMQIHYNTVTAELRVHRLHLQDSRVGCIYNLVDYSP